MFLNSMFFHSTVRADAPTSSCSVNWVQPGLGFCLLAKKSSKRNMGFSTGKESKVQKLS